MKDWISVNDHLPNIWGDYLVAFDDGTVMSFDYCPLDADRGYWGYEGIDSAKVTHWQELPEHPDDEGAAVTGKGG